MRSVIFMSAPINFVAELQTAVEAVNKAKAAVLAAEKVRQDAQQKLDDATKKAHELHAQFTQWVAESVPGLAGKSSRVI